MPKKRIGAIIISSPFLLVILAIMVLTACVGYATTGKWELKELIRATR